MSSTTSALRSVRFGPLPTQGILFGLAMSNLVTLAIAILILFAALMRFGVPGAAVSAIVWLPLMVVGVLHIHRVPLPVYLFQWGVFMVRHLSGGTSYRFRPEAPRVEGSLHLPGRRSALQVWEGPTSGAAVVFDPFERTVSITAEIDVHGFLLLDEDEQAQVVSSWSRALASFTQRDGIARVVMQERTAPASLDPAERSFAAAIARPVAQDEQTVVITSYEAVLHQLRDQAVSHQNYLTIAISLKSRGAQLKSLGGGEAAACAVAELELSAAADAVEKSGFRVRRWLTPRQWAGLGRLAFDPDFAAEVAQRTGAGEGVDIAAIGPMALDEPLDKPAIVRTDSAVHTTMWIHEWPRTDTAPGFMQPVVFAQRADMAQAVSHIFSIVCEPVKTRAALREIERQKKTWMTNASLRQKRGQLVSELDHFEFQAIREREQEVVAGHGEFRFAGYLTVSATDEQALNGAVAGIRNGLAQAALEPQVLYFQQAEALMMNALPTGGGLK